MKDKIMSVWEWLKTCPDTGNMYLIYDGAGDMDAVFIPLGETVSPFIDDTARRLFEGRIVVYERIYPSPNEYAGRGAIDRAEAIREWIDASAKAGDVPAFPDGCRVQNVFSLAPGKDAASFEGGWAMYAVDFIIDYIE
ncbi:MAG: hypothetical protein Q4D04_13455 [Clostridia bacterium]|nr:hypothetical protein [Clostridia bacterium]